MSKFYRIAVKTAGDLAMQELRIKKGLTKVSNENGGKYEMCIGFLIVTIENDWKHESDHIVISVTSSDDGTVIDKRYYHRLSLLLDERYTEKIRSDETRSNLSNTIYSLGISGCESIINEARREVYKGVM